jgi:hypothetical protein
MLTVYKEKLDITQHQEVELPSGYKILTINLQNNLPMIWFLCDTENPKVPVTIHMYNTGQSIAMYPGRYISTVHPSRGTHVVHCFEGN